MDFDGSWNKKLLQLNSHTTTVVKPPQVWLHTKLYMEESVDPRFTGTKLGDLALTKRTLPEKQQKRLR